MEESETLVFSDKYQEAKYYIQKHIEALNTAVKQANDIGLNVTIRDVHSNPAPAQPMPAPAMPQYPQGGTWSAPPEFKSLDTVSFKLTSLYKNFV